MDRRYVSIDVFVPDQWLIKLRSWYLRCGLTPLDCINQLRTHVRKLSVNLLENQLTGVVEVIELVEVVEVVEVVDVGGVARPALKGMHGMAKWVIYHD